MPPLDSTTSLGALIGDVACYSDDSEKDASWMVSTRNKAPLLGSDGGRVGSQDTYGVGMKIEDGDVRAELGVSKSRGWSRTTTLIW